MTQFGGSDALRETMRMWPSGVAVITTRTHDGRPVGITVNSLISVSFEPPLIAWCAARSLRGYRTWSTAAGWLVNVLSAGQAELASTFAQSGIDKFDGVDYLVSPAGNPKLAACAGYLECTTWRNYDGGDHVMILGQVRGLERTDQVPMTLHLQQP